MHIKRSLFAVLVALIAASANAQFDGPAPLAWRWLSQSGVASSGAPLVNGDIIYEAAGGRIYAIDRLTGNKKWQYPPEDPIPGIFRFAPILAKDTLIAVGDNKIIYAIDPTTGSGKWNYTLTAAPIGQPVLAGDLIVQAQSDNKLMAVDLASGQAAWKNKDTGDVAPYNVFDGVAGQIAASGQDVLYFTGQEELHCLDVITRTENIWARPIRFTQLSPYAVPLVYQSQIYVTSGQYLIDVDPASGVVTWQTETGFNTAFSPAASSQGVFVVSEDGQAMVYDLNTGQPTPGMPKPILLGSYPSTRPSAVGSKFVIPTTNGAINLIDPANGSILWSYVIRPIGTLKASKAASTGPGRGPGGAGQGFGAPGLGGGGQNNQDQEITELQASGPVALAGQTLLVPAQDSSLLAFDKDLGVDLTPPNVQMLFPTPGDQVAGQPPLVLFFKVRDEGSGVAETTLKVLIDGKEYDHTYMRDGSVIVHFRTSGKNPYPGQGRHTITLDVADWLGNEARQDFAITIDNSLPPVVLPGQATNNNGRPGFGGGGPGKGGGGGED
ncbi:MAG TPA: PQQ-binding-like beta-propeller repeat protein [Fimbriimonas sp.]|nr:PQQ-binding-like beta-propeller repeat protein [Fimbriimonas sp.]